MSTRTALLTALAMLAFAANSLLCRLALGAGEIDAASFMTIRVVSGAVTLAAILLVQTKALRLTFNPRTTFALLAYMVFFSFAYVTLGAAAGALILFGAVQLTMFGFALNAREHFPPLAWGGLMLAGAGLVYLVSPGLSAPDPLGAVLMAIAGVSWGAYSIYGRGAADPLAATASNFIFITPAVLAVSLATLGNAHISTPGIMLAVASGALASGCGYVVWYAALGGLTTARAATVQLSVPVIAAIGAVLLLSEPPTLRLVLAVAATLGGVAIVLSQRAAASTRP